MMLQPSISWDGSRAAVFGIDDYKRGIWIHDLARQSKSRLNLSDLGAPNNPAWQPGDARLSYVDGWTLQDVALEGSAPVNPLEGMGTGVTVNATWSRDGRYLAFAGYGPDTRGDIWVLERGENKARPVVETPAGEADPTLAPDARHVAYLSDETGRPELFVRTFPGGTDKVQLTSNGAAFPTWSRRGDEIFYVQGHTLMTVPVLAGPPFRAGTPARLFDLEEHAGRVRLYDTADGQRFLVVRTIEPWEQGIAVVQNWYEEFRHR
jgi:serine/threonine-protein kinase